MYPDRDTIEHTFNTARDQSMVESGVTEGGKNTARSSQFSFLLCEHNDTTESSS